MLGNICRKWCFQHKRDDIGSKGRSSTELFPVAEILLCLLIVIIITNHGTSDTKLIPLSCAYRNIKATPFRGIFTVSKKKKNLVLYQDDQDEMKMLYFVKFRSLKSQPTKKTNPQTPVFSALSKMVRQQLQHSLGIQGTAFSGPRSALISCLTSDTASGLWAEEAPSD